MCVNERFTPQRILCTYLFFKYLEQCGQGLRQTLESYQILAWLLHENLSWFSKLRSLWVLFNAGKIMIVTKTPGPHFKKVHTISLRWQVACSVHIWVFSTYFTFIPQTVYSKLLQYVHTPGLNVQFRFFFPQILIFAWSFTLWPLADSSVSSMLCLQKNVDATHVGRLMDCTYHI